MKISKTQSPTFQAMKPNQFNGFDYACVRKFKAPVEKFNSQNDLFVWAKDKVNTLVENKMISGKNDYAIVQRKDLIKEWLKALTFSLEKTPTALVVLSSILGEIKSTNDVIPLIVSPTILTQTLNKIGQELEKNKDYQFNFKNIYNTNLQNHYLQNNESNYTGWIKIPSKVNDLQNFKENTDKLKVLSNKTWCTKSYLSEVLLAEGDFYIWLEKGEPKIGLRYTDRLLSEIQSERNDGVLDVKYFDIVKNFLSEKGSAMDEKALKTYNATKKLITKKS